MNLIDRYVHAIRRNLPRDRAEDIAAELHDLLASRVEDREEALGRPLDANETKTILRGFGHPLVVAARYRKHQWLIGPDVFPFYLSVLRIVLTIAAAAVAIGIVANLVLNGRLGMAALGQALASFSITGWISFGIVTIVFVVLERSGFPADHMRRWDPANLPEARDPQPGPWQSAIEVALNIAFLLWWSGLVHLPFSAGGPGFRIEPAPIFTRLYWPILALIALRLVHNLVQWLRPRQRAVRTMLAALTALGGLALLVILYRAGQWATILSTGMDARHAAELQTSVNLALKIAIVVTAIIWTLQLLRGLYHLSRNRIVRPSPV